MLQLFNQAYPKLVEEFNKEKAAKQSAKKSSKSTKFLSLLLEAREPKCL